LATHRFYRTHLSPKTPNDDWKNHAVYPTDPFLSAEPGWGRFESRWLKFALPLNEPYRIYFQDSTKYLFHYDFAVARLPQFSGLTRAQFDTVSLRLANQQVALGAVLFAPTENLPEIALQFVGLDPYSPGQVAEWFDRVRAVLEAPANARLFYFPTYEQQGVANANREFFRQRGIEVSSAGRWTTADECYAQGWALGRLMFVPAAALAEYYNDGRLRPTDILLIDAVPAEIPPVAGVISLAPATPNSHVAILAQSFGIPFVYFASEAMRDQLRTWSGHEVVLRAAIEWGASVVSAVNIEAQLTPALRAEILALKEPPILAIPPMQRLGQLSMAADGLYPADVQYVGGKAANLGMLRRAIPTNSPSPAIAFTFDLWNDYLDQTLPGGKTLRTAVQERLAGFTWPPDVAQLKAALATIRDLFTDEADFSPAQRQAVLAILIGAGFGADRNIRFRSSTNVEDSEQFSGAGLYDSFSGCLADDLDGDNDGPSVCDPTEPRERGVFRAMRKVYASFYNDNAYLERLRHRVNEAQVGMGLLVHHSTPDVFELANGVATVAVTKGATPQERGLKLTLVTQAGAVSVTNPDSTASPEVVLAHILAGIGPSLEFQKQSSLVQLGATVLTWEADYLLLTRLLDQASDAYEEEFPAKKQFTLDFEYKKVAPEGALRVKQIRAVPPAPSEDNIVPWLLNETNRWGVLQGELADPLGLHRLKSSWILETANLRLASSNLTQSLYRRLNTEYLAGMTLTNGAGEMTTLPEFQHSRDGEYTQDRWYWGEGAARRRFELRTLIPTESPAKQGPLVFLRDTRLQLTVTYQHPQARLDWQGPTNTLTDAIALVPVATVSPRSQRQTRTFSGQGVTVTTGFYWPPPPAGPTAGYTAPLQAWVETTITGLTSQPITLHGDFSQTYKPEHHNISENFVFDPHLETGIDPAILDELRARNIRALVVGLDNFQSPDLWIWGLDDSLRKL
jgi:hypothetical protein